MSDDLGCDPGTISDFDRTALDGSEGLDGGFLTGSGENYVMDTPDRWRGVSSHDILGKRLTEEKPDIDVDGGLSDDPEMRHGDVDGHEPFEFDNGDPRDPDRNRWMGWTTY